MKHQAHLNLASRLLLAVLLAAVLPALAVADSSSDSLPPYACSDLDEALHDLSSKGLPLVWSDGLVHFGQQIQPSTAREAAASADSRASLDVLLRPFGLQAEAAADGDLLLIVDAEGGSGAALTPRVDVDEGSLPPWTDRSALPTVWQYPPETTESATPPSAVLTADAPPFLVVRLRAEAFRARDGVAVDWLGLAFDLKERLVELESQRPGLLVALEADPILTGRFVSQGLAPYLDAYVHRGNPFVPEVDATARTWWWVDSPRTALPVLLDAALRGEGLVIFAGQDIEPLQRAFLDALDASGTAEAEPPPFTGLAQDRVRFLIHPSRGDLLLAVYAEPRATELSFQLTGVERIEAVLPPRAPFQSQQTREARGSVRLWLDGRSPYYIFRLQMSHEARAYRGVEVSDTELVDPYEQVERNQVFQRREREKFESLDVMEFIGRTPQWPGGEQIDWTHRILQHKGKLTEFHHLGYALNGTPYPQEKLLMGRLFRTEALIQLYPLELEFDETYAYRYLGQELVAGRDAYKIEFEPLRGDSKEEGTLVRGTLWIDHRNASHLRIRIVQKGLDGSLVQRETTTNYGWIPDDDHCFWDWQRRTGVSVFSSAGETYSYREETVRKDFDYNRPDIEQVVQAGHESDVMIHVETPPQGHRWLIRAEGGNRRVRDRAEPYPESGLDAEESTSEPVFQSAPASDEVDEVGGVGGAGDGSLQDEEEQLWSSRLLADIHAFSRHANLNFGGFTSQRAEDVEIYPGIVLTDSDFLNRGIEVYLGLFHDRLVGTFTKAGLFGHDVVFSGLAEISFESEFNPGSDVLDGTVVNTGIFVQQHEFRFDFAIPVARGLTSHLGYSLRTLRTQSNRVEGFVQPLDTAEHVLLLGLDLRKGAGLATLGLEAGLRDEWRAWGLHGAEPVYKNYTVARAAYGTYRRFSDRNSLGAELVLSKGWDLDRFSRLPFGGAREIVVGFGSGRGFDEGAFAGITWATSLGHKVPITFLLEGGHQRIETEDWIDRVGISGRFLVHGPFRLDIWPILGYGIASSLEGEAGNFSYGLVLRRRY